MLMPVASWADCLPAGTAFLMQCLEEKVLFSMIQLQPLSAFYA